MVDVAARGDTSGRFGRHCPHSGFPGQKIAWEGTSRLLVLEMSSPPLMQRAFAGKYL